MFRFLLQKIRHKKWLAICMLIGNVLLVAVACGYPMYKASSLQRMLSDEFDSYQKENGSYPGVIAISANALRGELLDEYAQTQELSHQVLGQMKVLAKQEFSFTRLTNSKANPVVARDDIPVQNFRPAALSDFDRHTTVTSGRMYSSERLADGTLEVVVTEACFVEKNLLLDEEYVFSGLKDVSGEKLKIKIVGVVKNSEKNDVYWVKKPDEYRHEVFMAPELFASLFLGDNIYGYNVSSTWYEIGDCDSLSFQDAVAAQKNMERLLSEERINATVEMDGFKKVLPSFVGKQKKIEATLMILQIPVLALLAAFLFMISGQMLSMEQNEISQLKSRGAGKGQIIGLYLMQNVLLAAVSFVIGFPAGMGLCSLLGSSTAFLEFGKSRRLPVTITKEAFVYAGAALLISVFLTLLPVLRYSNVSIVHVKQKKSQHPKKLWQKLFLDVILTAVSLYGYYSFSGRMEQLKANVTNGKPLDPLLYLSASMFILGMGLLFLRLQPYLIRGLFFLCKKRLHPAGYVSFLQTIRTGTKQQFIMLFLVITVSLGIFNATVARTIIANAEKNTTYLTGVDLAVKEYWKSNEAAVARDPSLTLRYWEPDFGKYSQIEHVISATRVFRGSATFEQETGKVNNKVKDATPVQLMGINTKEYGEIVKGDKNLNEYQLNEYLNVLSTNAQAVLLSESFRTKFGLKIGDTITYSNSEGKTASGIVYGFFRYWTDFVPTHLTEVNGETLSEDNFMIVAHLSAIQDSFLVRPYEIWMKTDGTDIRFFYDWAKENGYTFTMVEGLSDRLEAIRTDTLFQGTNGILTLSFIIILLLCGVGYLIYWILSIRERELLFGILRAMGMRKNEILQMLFMEQGFCGVLSILFGGVVGALASRLFVPMIQLAYAAEDQVLPQQLITEGRDTVKLFAVIAVMLVVCIIVLIRNIAKMKITNALKLGED